MAKSAALAGVSVAAGEESIGIADMSSTRVEDAAEVDGLHLNGPPPAAMRAMC